MTKTALETIKTIKPFIAGMVEEKLVEILGDDESGCALTPEVKRRIRMRTGKQDLLAADTVAKRYGLKW